MICWGSSSTCCQLLRFLFAVTCFALYGRLYLLISHVSAQEGACCQDEKGNFFLPSRPRVLLFSLSSAPHCAAELSRRPFRLPGSLHRSHTGKRCVGSSGDSVCAPMFTDIHLHMSPSWPITGHILTFGFGETKLPPVATYYTFIIALHTIVSPLNQLTDEISVRFSPCSLIWLWAAKNILLSWYSSHGKTSQTLSSLKWKQAALVQTPITFWHISTRIHTPEQIKPLCLTNLLPPSSNSIPRSTEITSLTTLPISYKRKDSLCSISESLIRWTLTLAMLREEVAWVRWSVYQSSEQVSNHIAPPQKKMS